MYARGEGMGGRVGWDVNVRFEHATTIFSMTHLGRNLRVLCFSRTRI